MPHDFVLSGGRVLDPETGLDQRCDVGVDGRSITAIGDTLDGSVTIDIDGLVVAPGFIDLHSHAQTLPGRRLQACDGVTTALELEAGRAPSTARTRAKRSADRRSTTAFRRRGPWLVCTRSRAGRSTVAPRAVFGGLIGEEWQHAASDAQLAADPRSDRDRPRGRRDRHRHPRRLHARRRSRGVSRGRGAGRVGRRPDVHALTRHRRARTGDARRRRGRARARRRVRRARTCTTATSTRHRRGTSIGCWRSWRGASRREATSRPRRIRTARVPPRSARPSSPRSVSMNGCAARTRSRICRPANASPTTRACASCARPTPEASCIAEFLDETDPHDLALVTTLTHVPRHGRRERRDAADLDGERARRTSPSGRCHPRPSPIRAPRARSRARCASGARKARRSSRRSGARRCYPRRCSRPPCPRCARRAECNRAPTRTSWCSTPARITDQATYASSTRPSSGIAHVIVDGTFVVRDGELVQDALPGRPIRAEPR